MKHHPYSEIFPLLDGARFEELKRDIAANGLRVSLITWRDQLLDGRNRERACLESGIEPRYVEADVKSDDEALSLVVSLNKHRRHLSVAELAIAAEQLAKLRHGSNRFQNISRVDCSPEQSISDNPLIARKSAAEYTTETLSLREAAEAVGVSYGSAARARIIRNLGTDQDVEDVLSGKATLNAKADKLRAQKSKSKPRSPKQVRVVSYGRHINSTGRNLMLTPEQVDPDFKGTRIEFVDRHGHVQIRTAIERATDMFNSLAANMRSSMKAMQALPEWVEMDQYWLDKLQNPNPRDVAKMTEAVDYIETKAIAARLALDAAVAALKTKP